MTATEQAAALSWLRTPQGAALLAEAAELPPDRLTRLSRLRRHTSVELAMAAVALLELRARARHKFTRADALFLTGEGLEQSTGETIARYRAARFPPDVPLLDACCGVGGDAMALVERGPVVAVDCNPAAVVCARANAALGGASAPHPFFACCADVTTLDLCRLRDGGVAAALFDPSRRADSDRGGRRRVRAGTDYGPPLAWSETLRSYLPALAVKVSPAIDDTTLHRFPARVEFISERGECKEAVLWFGPLADALPSASARAIEGSGAPRAVCSTIVGAQASGRIAGEAGYCATILRPGAAAAHLLPFACDMPPLSVPHAWLYEPDPAVIRAHLVPQIAALLSAAQLDAQIVYLTSDRYSATPFATAYRVLDWLPFHLKNVQRRLRALGRRVVAIKRRGVPLEPDALRKRLTGTDAPGDAPAVVVLTRLADQPIALLCEPSSGPTA